jgi:hypothetical protein
VRVFTGKLEVHVDAGFFHSSVVFIKDRLDKARPQCDSNIRRRCGGPK